MPSPRLWIGFGLLLATIVAPRGAVAQEATSSQGWMLTPAGDQVELGDRPFGMALSPDGRSLLISNDGQSTESLMVFDRASASVVQTIAYEAPEALFLGVVYSPDGQHAYASAGGNNKVRFYDVVGQQLTDTGSVALPTTNRANPYPAGLAISSDGATLYVADNLTDSLTAIDVAQRAVRDTVKVGHNPYAVLVGPNGSIYVSNWGEASISIVHDIANHLAVAGQPIPVGTHPSALALNPQRPELYVANTDSDSVSTIDTRANQVVRTIDLAPYPLARHGSSPNALAPAPDGGTLYVANAGNNDVAVVRLEADGGRDQVEGLIPTAWYPTALAIAPDGQSLYVANAKGMGAGPNPGGPNPYERQTPPSQFVASMMVGTLSVVPVPDADQLASYTAQVVQNNGFDERDQLRLAGNASARVIPRQPGDPSPITHVIYVIKENRTYDQVFGSLEQGNGDPSLNLFGEESAPNQRALARRFVTFDNFFADAEVSADGWNWSTAAEANTYVQKNWPANYATGRNRPYEFEGGNLATAPGPDPGDAYLWNRLERAGISYRNYGFWVFQGKVASTAPDLVPNTDPGYPGYDLRISDQSRVDEWLAEFSDFVANDSLPTVELVRLPNDHTAGTTPDMPTPRAMMADNDLALGRMVEAVSHSPYWPNTAIFVVEDDAQNGPDHVDAHRTVAQIISPYTQTGGVDSTFYSTSSMLRTIELIVGVGPMSQFDAAATPMLNAFTEIPNLQAYDAVTPDQPLDELNAADAPLAAESAGMDLAGADRAPEHVLNAAIWRSIRGSESAMPAPVTQFRSAGPWPRGRDDDGD